MLHSHTRLISEVAEIFSTPWRVARRSFNLEHQQNSRWRLESATIWKKMETERLFYISVLLCLFCICQVHGQDEDPCKGVVCPRGRMCVSSTDSGESYTTCECPEECSSDSEPVCSFYHREFNNRCEMHRYACAHDLTMKVMNRGKCPTENQYACSEQFLLQFPTRYLEWITIAREHSIDPTTSLDFNARADGLTEDERKEILSWEFEYIDRDKNNVLDTAEIQDVFSDVLDFEPCLYGFLKSCDLNEKEGIDKREWDFCFPKTGTAFETRK